MFHRFNRCVGRRKIFYNHRDYAAFEAVLESTLELVPLRLLSYCLIQSEKSPARTASHSPPRLCGFGSLGMQRGVYFNTGNRMICRRSMTGPVGDWGLRHSA